MINWINSNQGVISLLAFVLACVTYFFASKLLALGVIIIAAILIAIAYLRNLDGTERFDRVRQDAKILFIDDKRCQIVKNLQRNQFDVRKIDDVVSPTTDPEVKWANIIFVDYKDVGKKLFGKKEGLGLINELKRIYGEKKRYIIYSSEQDFDGLVEFPYIRKNASYDEFISLINAEYSKI